MKIRKVEDVPPFSGRKRVTVIAIHTGESGEVIEAELADMCYDAEGHYFENFGEEVDDHSHYAILPETMDLP